MAVVWVKFSAKINAQKVSTGSLVSCPVCGEDRIQRWGKTNNSNPDSNQCLAITRFRCASCGHTFFDPIKYNLKQTHLDTIQSIAGLLWIMGFSIRQVEELFQRLGVGMSRSSIWRAVKRMGMLQAVSRMNDQPYKIDPSYVPGISEKLGVVVGLKLADGPQVVLGVLPIDDPKAVQTYLAGYLSAAKVEIEISGEKAVQSHEIFRGSCPYIVG
jgi:transposase-like protein